VSKSDQPSCFSLSRRVAGSGELACEPARRSNHAVPQDRTSLGAGLRHLSRPHGLFPQLADVHQGACTAPGVRVRSDTSGGADPAAGDPALSETTADQPAGPVISTGVAAGIFDEECRSAPFDGPRRRSALRALKEKNAMPVHAEDLLIRRSMSSFGAGGPYSGDAYVANASRDADRGKCVPCGSPSRRSNSRLLMA
jgi:hypothetical protein